MSAARPQLPLTHPALRPALRGMKLWCETGQHPEPRTVRCDGCGRRCCPRHSRWVTPPKPERARRVCDDCARRTPPRA